MDHALNVLVGEGVLGLISEPVKCYFPSPVIDEQLIEAVAFRSGVLRVRTDVEI